MTSERARISSSLAKGGSERIRENFTYDRLDRLTGSTVEGEESGSGVPYLDTVTYRYDALGNMLEKSDVSSQPFSYGAQQPWPGGSAGPHAVREVERNGMWEVYEYDDNGNTVSGGGRQITWTSFNKPSHIERNGNVVSFAYGPDRARYKKTTHVDFDYSVTLYLGKDYERVENDDGTVTHKHFIYTEDGLAAIHIEHEDAAGYIDNSRDETRYMHRDALGSIDTVTGAQGQVLDRMGFAPFGARRGGDWRVSNGVSLTPAYTNRGFTEHEHLDAVGLIHMNGRVYDPEIGRFLSADPHVQAPYNSQSYNRYSYVLNNPMKYTDPSGFLTWDDVLSVGLVIGAAFLGGWALIQAVGYSGWGAVATFASLGASKAVVTLVAASFVGGFTASMVATSGNLKQSLKSGFFAAISAGAAIYIGGLAGISEVGRDLLHGLSQGLISEVSGGDFKSGFVGAFVGHAGGRLVRQNPTLMRILGGSVESRTATAAVLGGTAAVLGGGKFANGAISAAFAHLFNNELQCSGQMCRGQRDAAEFESRMREMLRVGHAGVGHHLTYAEAKWWWQNANGAPLIVDGRVLTVDNIYSELSDYFGPRYSIVGPGLLTDVRVYGTENLDPFGHITDSVYDFDHKSWSGGPVRWVRNTLNVIAEVDHGQGVAFTIKFRYDDKYFH